jgi:hypothetical protein
MAGNNRKERLQQGKRSHWFYSCSKRLDNLGELSSPFQEVFVYLLFNSEI